MDLSTTLILALFIPLLLALISLLVATLFLLLKRRSEAAKMVLELAGLREERGSLEGANNSLEAAKLTLEGARERLERELLISQAALAQREVELAAARSKEEGLREGIDNLKSQVEGARVLAVEAYRSSPEFASLLRETRERALLEFKDQEGYQRLLGDSLKHSYCDEERKRVLGELARDYEERLAREREEFNRLQEQFNFEKRYKNVSNIGEQLTSAIVDKLTEAFLSSGLVTINPTPPLKAVASKRNKSVRTDVLLEVFSPLQRERRILTVVIEAKNQKPDTLEPQRNKRHFEQLFEQLEAYEADYALLVTELEPENSYLTIAPVDNRDDVFMLRLSYLVGFLQILIRFAFKSEYYGQDHKRLKSRENLIRIIDSGRQELEDKQFRYLNDSNKRIRDRCESIKGMLDDIDELTHKNDRRLKLSSKKLLSFYEAVHKEVKLLPGDGVRLLSSQPTTPTLEGGSQGVGEAELEAELGADLGGSEADEEVV